MRQEQFTAMMSYISNDLVAMISERNNIPPQDAIEILYSSKLYSLLENEDTKLWHYSTKMLYTMFSEEQKSGKITFPDS